MNITMAPVISGQVTRLPIKLTRQAENQNTWCSQLDADQSQSSFHSNRNLINDPATLKRIVQPTELPERYFREYQSQLGQLSLERFMLIKLKQQHQTLSVMTKRIATLRQAQDELESFKLQQTLHKGTD